MLGPAQVIAFAVVALVAASPAYYFLRRTSEGRARGAIAYIAGFLTGIAATSLLMPVRPPVVEAGLLAAFVGPFLGMTRARWIRMRRRRKARLRAIQKLQRLQEQ